MRRIVMCTLVSLLACVLLSCSKSGQLERAAKKQMEATLKEIAKDPASVKLENIQTKYVNDSLCIIHADFTAKNGLGMESTNKEEYVFLRSNGKDYEAYHDLNGQQGVYVNEETYTKNKKGTIYESLNYADGLRYLAALFVQGYGREAGAKEDKEFSIPVPTGTGYWVLSTYTDEFGDTGSSKYLSLASRGVFSNSATTNSELIAVLFYEKSGSFSIRLIEYGSNIVKDDDRYECSVKDSKGNVYRMTLYNDDDEGQLTTSKLFVSDIEENSKIWKTILGHGGIISVAIKNYYSTSSTYRFKMDVSGFEKAVKYL